MPDRFQIYSGDALIVEDPQGWLVPMQRDFVAAGKIERGLPFIGLIEFAPDRQARNGLGPKATQHGDQSCKHSPSRHNCILPADRVSEPLRHNGRAGSGASYLGALLNGATVRAAIFQL